MFARSAFQCLVAIAAFKSCGLVRAAPAESADSLLVSFASPLGSPSSSSAKVAIAEIGVESLTLVSTRQIGPITESILSISTSSSASGLEKRGLVDLRGAKCETTCGFAQGPMAIPEDCVVVYKTLYNQAGSFTILTKNIVHWNYNNCAAYLINNSGDSITYDYLDYGGVSQWLNGYCVKDRGATIGTCLFAQYSSYSDGVYTSVNHPNYFGNSSNSTAPSTGTTPSTKPDAVDTNPDTDTDTNAADTGTVPA